MNVRKLMADLKKYLWDLEPVFTAGTTQAIVALIVALFHPSAWVTGVVEAGFGLLTAVFTMLKVEPKRPALFTGVVVALGTLLVALGVPHVNSGSISAVNGLLAIVLASMLREKVTPKPPGATRQAISQLTKRRAAMPSAQAVPDTGMARLASDAGAAAAALARVAADAKIVGDAPVPQPRNPDTAGSQAAADT